MSFLKNSTPNTVSIIDYLWQVCQLQSRQETLCEKLHYHLSNFVYRENSCCRDKVNRLVGRQSSCYVFLVSLIEFTLTRNLFTSYLDLSAMYRIKIANRCRHIHLQFRSMPTRKPKNCKRMWLSHQEKPPKKTFSNLEF